MEVGVAVLGAPAVAVLVTSSVLCWLTECLSLGWRLPLAGRLVPHQPPLVRGRLAVLTSSWRRLPCDHSPDLVARLTPPPSTSPPPASPVSSVPSLARWRSWPCSVRSDMKTRAGPGASHVWRWRPEPVRRRLWRSHPRPRASTSHARGAAGRKHARRAPEAEGSSHAGRWWAS